MESEESSLLNLRRLRFSRPPHGTFPPPICSRNVISTEGTGTDQKNPTFWALQNWFWKAHFIVRFLPPKSHDAFCPPPPFAVFQMLTYLWPILTYFNLFSCTGRTYLHLRIWAYLPGWGLRYVHLFQPISFAENQKGTVGRGREKKHVTTICDKRQDNLTTFTTIGDILWQFPSLCSIDITHNKSS